MGYLDKMNGKSMDLVKQNIETLKKLFPEIVREGKIDFDSLKLILGEEVDEANEKFDFTWVGKKKAIRRAMQVSTGTLRPCKEESKNWDTTKNLYIEGDNLEVLRLLQQAYYNKIKMIYIDPPYNTGNDFVYNDDFSETVQEYVKNSGQALQSNPETSGRFHSNWLNMLYSRLRLAKNLLRDDGVIFISIDDHEVHNLRVIMNQIFGEENFIGCFVWKRRVSSALAERRISTDHEYILAYQKLDFISEGEAKDFRGYSNPDNDPRGDWIADNLTVGMTREQRPNQFYDLVDPVSGRVYPANPNRVWAYIPESMEKLIKENRILFPEDTNKRPMLKRFKNELKSDVNPVSTWMVDVGLNSQATKEIQELFGSSVFSYSKPVSLLEKLILTSTTKDDIILDFFSGSATTAQAVIQSNAKDDGSRKFIMVQIPEPIQTDKRNTNAQYQTICEIGKERIRRAGDKIVAETGKTDLDIGFKVFKLDTSNLKEWDSETKDLEKQIAWFGNPIKEDRTSLDVVYEIMLKYGVDLTIPVHEEKLNGKTVYNIGAGALFVCLDDDITVEIAREIANRKPLRVVFKDAGFKDDNAKLNVVQILKHCGIEEIRSI